jgi:hypothetical protein
MSQVLVPRILVRVPFFTPAPTAPMWASKAPTATADAGGQAEFLRPLRREIRRRGCPMNHARSIETAAQVGEGRIQFGEEFRSPAGRPIRR